MLHLSEVHKAEDSGTPQKWIKSSISPVSFDLKKLEEEEQMKPKLNRLVEIIKSRKSVK